MAQTALARADLEALLKARKLDRTLQPTGDAGPAERAAAPAGRMLPTGLSALDARLGGGLPRGQMSELVGPRSSGRTALMSAALAAATGRGELAALVDPLDAFDPESAASCGVALERLLWIRGEGMTAGPLPLQAKGQADRVLDRAVKALNLVLQAGGFDLVVLDCAEVEAAAIGRLPFTTWFRLQRVVEGSRTVCLLVGPAPISRSASGVSIQLSAARPGLWAPPLFRGLDIQARVVCSRDADDGRCRLEARTWGRRPMADG
jgi:hypothetical protein